MIIARALILVACLLLITCSAQGVTVIEARSGRVNFSMDEAMARGSFESFCASVLEEVCDPFEKYFIDVRVAENEVTLVFSHEDPYNAPENVAAGFYCGYVAAEPDCHSGLHKYD